MPNIIDANGLTVKTNAEIIAEITAALKLVYGDDINVAPDSPDGQQINIFTQAIVDVEDLVVQVYNSFNPDMAIGVTLDERVAINGIQRLGGTYTMQKISVTTDRAMTLQGLDGDLLNPDGTGYTVSDSQGNQFILAATEAIAAAGTYSLVFRAKEIGAVLTVPNTITTPVTIKLGVTSVNNPLPADTIGDNEETDAELRTRRQQSVSLASQGYLEGLRAEILNISGVTYAKIYENNSGVTDGDGIPSHSIWVIVEGGNESSIAYAIYTKRNAGCGMKGDEVVQVTQPDGSIFAVKFDRTVSETLYVQFTAQSINGIDPIDTAYIKDEVVTRLTLDVNESVNVNDISAIVRDIDPNCLVTVPKVSKDGMTWLDIVSPSAKNKRFTLLATDIDITVI